MVSNWKDFDTAPKDGRAVLACRNTGFGWQYHVVWWFYTGNIYPWNSADNAYPEGQFDYWTELVPPHD